jgi:hypothetical protein
MSSEDAFLKPKEKGIESITVKLGENQSMTFSTVTAAHKKLTELKLTTAKYQTVVSYLNKKYTPEASFGLVKRPWELRYENLDQLVLQDAYNYVGSKHHLSIPILVESEKKYTFQSENLQEPMVST